MKCYEIVPKLFLSDRAFASCKACLALHKITHILTIDGTALTFNQCTNHNTTAVSDSTAVVEEPIFKFIYALDQLNFNIMDLFTNAIEFIKDSIASGSESNVLVHCLMGQSRSVSVVSAYLMCTQALSLKESLELIKKEKGDAQPNPGFLYQLWLFESMGSRVDKTSHHYRSFQTKQEQLTYYRTLYQQEKPPIEEGDGNKSEAKEGVGGNRKADTYKCRMCRTVLFTSSDLVESHTTSPSTALSCTSLHMVEPLSWVRDQMKDEVQGKINCKKCNAKLGSFNWSGTSCSCGVWVTPSFQIHKARVDMSFSQLP